MSAARHRSPKSPKTRWSSRYRNVALPLVAVEPLRQLAQVLAAEQRPPHTLTDGEAAHQAILEALDRRRAKGGKR